MPWKPDFSQHRPEARFAGYRDRVGRLFRDHEEVGLLMVRTEPVSTQESGHLWWRRWGKPYEQLWLWTIVDGNFSDTLGPDDYADEQLREFASGRLLHYGETLRIQWVSEKDAERLRETQFGYVE
jgi:hypothetical protein